MILNVRKYKLDEVDLKKNEMRLLLLLSDNKCWKAEDIKKYLKVYSDASIYRIKESIYKKLGKRIIANNGRNGCSLIINIEIDY